MWFDSCHTPEQARRRYRQLARQYHPDRGGDEATMKAIIAEYAGWTVIPECPAGVSSGLWAHVDFRRDWQEREQAAQKRRAGHGEPFMSVFRRMTESEAQS